MSDKDLQKIQSLQFTDLEAANQLLKEFFKNNLPFDVKTVSLRPLAVSLNSINGIIFTEEGEKLFFKTHVEPQSIISEYYNSQILADANYPVIQPIFSSTEWGKQLLIYKFFDFPSLFDVAREIETNKRDNAEKIIDIQEKSDDDLWSIYQKTLQTLTAKEHSESPIHQLFYHRLTGGRFSEFYQDTELSLPGQVINYNDLSKRQWVINGIEFQDSLAELVNLASEYLNPEGDDTISIVGHGDAHNGNVFVDEANNNLIYFDPAFAGRHSPFLDLTKPLFHNVFAIWMYFPQEVAKDLNISWEIKANKIIVNHNFIPSALRIAFLRSKLARVLQPLLKLLRSQNKLPENWRQYLKLALFCCPFLTMNLSDRNKFSPEITLLGLCLSVEMGSKSINEQQSLLDWELEQIIVALNHMRAN